jgi:RsiW-degrading membrane proteinase PrsW (M82 family)
MGTLLMLLSLAAFEFLEQITALPEALRVVFLFAFLGGTFGFFANRVLNSIEFRVWPPRQ